MRYILLALLHVSSVIISFSQAPVFYQSPMKYPIELSGTFAEIRSVNFHSGIDIRVSNRADKNVYAVGDGWVSRIKIQSTGYGKVLYIDHPEGYTSVYAHLDRFNGEIEKLVRQIQYQRQSYEIDVLFPPDSLRIKKNQFIGIAGNTGFSFGPHLHFEIRETSSQEVLDPLFFGIKYEDRIAPEFEVFKIYVHGNGLVNGQNVDKTFSVQKIEANTYQIARTIDVAGAVSFGFGIRDRQSGSNHNRLGISAIQIFVDDTLWFDVRFERLAFRVLRHQLAYIDVPALRNEKKHVHTTWRKPGNRLPIYRVLQQDGIFFPSEGRTYNMLCRITDAAGNQSVLRWRLRGQPLMEPLFLDKQCRQGEYMTRYGEPFEWKGHVWSVYISDSTLFADQCFMISERDSAGCLLNKKLYVHSDIPPATYYNIGIATDTFHLRQPVIVHIDEKGKRTGILPEVHLSYLQARTTLYGEFVLDVDTIAPTLRPKNISKDGNISGLKKLRFHVQDNLTGIKSYAAFANETWLLLQYEMKDNELIYEVDDRLPSGKFLMRVVVEDGAGNRTTWEQFVIR